MKLEPATLRGGTRRRGQRVVLGATLLCALLAGGCGAAKKAPVETFAVIPFKSAAVAEETIPARYTCDGPDISPPLEWGAVPPGTGDVAVFLVGLTAEASTHTTSISVDWAIAGLSAQLHRLAADEIPTGAYLGQNSDGKHGYSLCPQRGAHTEYQFEIYGLPSGDSIAQNFAGLPLVNELTAPESTRKANSHGAFVATYTRRERPAKKPSSK